MVEVSSELMTNDTKVSDERRIGRLQRRKNELVSTFATESEIGALRGRLTSSLSLVQHHQDYTNHISLEQSPSESVRAEMLDASQTMLHLRLTEVAS